MHLRDRSGVIQLVFNPKTNDSLHKQAESLRSEYCISIQGNVVERDGEAKNNSLPTGMLEIHVTDLTIHSQAQTPPFMVTEKSQLDEHIDDFNVDEDLRLTYRYIDFCLLYTSDAADE